MTNKFAEISKELPKKELENPYKESKVDSKTVEQQTSPINISLKNKDKKVPLTVSISRSNEEYLDEITKQGVTKSEFVNKMITLAKEGQIKISIIN